MGFHVYPEPQTAAQSIGPGATATFTLTAADITAQTLFGADNVTVPGDPSPTGFSPAMFIRIAMLGAMPAAPNRPTVLIRLGAAATATELNAAPGLQKSIPDPTNPIPGSPGTFFDGANGFRYDPDVNNVYLVKILVVNATLDWEIQIKNNDPAGSREFTWVVASSLAESRRPWIHATPAILAYNVLINQAASLTTLTVSIANRGTGSLTVTSTTPALPASFTSSGLPATVAPNAPAGSIPVTFNAPATAGELAPATFAFDGDSGPTFGAGHNREVSLSAKTQALEIALLLDDSGSMSWEPDADPIPPAAGPSRWSSLVSAANLFLDLLSVFGANKGTFGVARFPPTNPINPSTYDIFPPTSIPSDMTSAQNAITAITPFFAGTPMGDGINRVLTPGANYFSTDPATVNLNRRWILLMTDGAENSSTHNSLEFIAPEFGGTAAPGTSLADKKIKVFSVGYGVEGKAEVNYPLLEQIADGSFEGGDTRQVESSGLSAPALAAAFRASIKSGLVSVSSPTDPGGTLRSDAAEARHRVIITPYDTKVAFVLNWHTENARRMSLHLLTPTCDLITPESAGEDFSTGDVGFSGASRYQIYRIEEAYLRNADDPARPRYGTWMMVVFSDELASSESSEDSEYYEYDVIVESRLQMDVRLDRTVYYAGDPIGLSAILTVDGKPITQATVTLSLTAPGQAVNNWLAAVKVSADEYRRAEEEVLQLTEKDTNALFIKAYAAQRKGITFEVFTNTATIPMTDPDSRGVYTASFSQTATPDDYKLYVTAVGVTEDGVVFRRERALQVRVGVRPAPDFTLFDVLYEPFPKDPRVVTAVVRVTPRDRFGNVVLIDPATSQDIVLRAEGGRFADKLTTSFDGTYTTSLVYNTGATPVIALEVSGEPVFKDRVIAPVDQLVYVDQVLEFQPGAEGEQGANQHTDPKDVLGDIRQKEPDRFVSLGAYGSLTVGLQRQVILAQGDDDITVFVQPDEDLRSYLVEVLSRGWCAKWVVLGTSPGVTQSFSLRQTKLKAAQAVRLTDESGRTRDSNFEPCRSPGPGVSFRGVGFKKIGAVSARSPWIERLKQLLCALLQRILAIVRLVTTTKR